MTAPFRTPTRSLYRSFVPVMGFALVGGLLAGCSSTVSGHPIAARNPGVTPVASADGGLAKLLPDPSQFPSRYTAMALPTETAKQAADDMNGYLPGAQVDPSGCVPATATAGPAVAVGSDENTPATLTVVLTRSDKPLSALRDQLQQCGTVRLGHSGVTSIVTTRLDPPPPANADDTLAIKRTIGTENSPTGLTRNMQSLIGQIGDVRISVTYMTSVSASDSEGLDTLFATALRKVRKG